jgi:hypothetical protein
MQRIFEQEGTRKRFINLLQFARRGQLSILLGRIDWDEMVAPASALMALEWLEQAQRLPGLSYDSFSISTILPMRAHDGLLHDTLALAYIDGLIDGLLPPRLELGYDPYDRSSLQRFLRRVLRVY